MMEVNNHSVIKATAFVEIHFPLNHENRDTLFSLSFSLSPSLSLALSVSLSSTIMPPPVEAQSEWRLVLPHLSGDIVTSPQLIAEAVPCGIQHDATHTTQGLGSQELHLRAKSSCFSGPLKGAVSWCSLFLPKEKSFFQSLSAFQRCQGYIPAFLKCPFSQTTT